MHAYAARIVAFPPLAGAGVIGPARTAATTTTITTRTISPVRPVVFA